MQRSSNSQNATLRAVTIKQLHEVHKDTLPPHDVLSSMLFDQACQSHSCWWQAAQSSADDTLVVDGHELHNVRRQGYAAW